MTEALQEQHVALIATELSVRADQVRATAELLAQGATVPFVARYRKEATASLDEVVIATIRDRVAQLRRLRHGGPPSPAPYVNATSCPTSWPLGSRRRRPWPRSRRVPAVPTQAPHPRQRSSAGSSHSPTFFNASGARSSHSSKPRASSRRTPDAEAALRAHATSSPSAPATTQWRALAALAVLVAWRVALASPPQIRRGRGVPRLLRWSGHSRHPVIACWQSCAAKPGRPDLLHRAAQGDALPFSSRSSSRARRIVAQVRLAVRDSYKRPRPRHGQTQPGSSAPTRSPFVSSPTTCASFARAPAQAAPRPGHRPRFHGL
jgi:hypothetical protein